MAQYTWASGYRSKVVAQIAGERIALLLGRTDGMVTPAQIVTDARSPRSPLHPQFEWQNDRAAEQYRLNQARQMLASLRIIVTHERVTNPEIPRRVFVSVIRETPQHRKVRAYLPISTALTDDTLRQQVLDQVVKQLRAFRQKYREYEELARLFVEVDRLAEQYLQ